jgi:hypothetical protein
MQSAIESLSTIVDQDSLGRYVFGNDANNDNVYAKDVVGCYMHLTPAIYNMLSIVIQTALDNTVFTAVVANKIQKYPLNIDSYVQRDDLCRQFVNHLINPRLGPIELKRTFNIYTMSVMFTSNVQLPGFELDAEVIWRIDQNNQARIFNINILYRN